MSKPPYIMNCDYDVIRTLPRIGKAQAFDCGWNVLLLSRNKMFRKKYRVSKKGLTSTGLLNYDVCGMFYKCEPECKKKSIFRSKIIYIADDLSLRYTIEVVIHEVSHLVDSILEYINVEEVDTEVRAYLNQYYCGHIFDMMSFENGKKKIIKPKLKFRKTKRNFKVEIKKDDNG